MLPAVSFEQGRVSCVCVHHSRRLSFSPSLSRRLPTINPRRLRPHGRFHGRRLFRVRRLIRAIAVTLAVPQTSAVAPWITRTRTARPSTSQTLSSARSWCDRKTPVLTSDQGLYYFGVLR